MAPQARPENSNLAMENRRASAAGSTMEETSSRYWIDGWCCAHAWGGEGQYGRLSENRSSAVSHIDD